MSTTDPMGGRDLSNPCKARSRAGQACGNAAIPGGSVCRFHGGNAPQVKRKAALRLLELVDPAIATLARTMGDQTAPHAARLRAAENVLDRAGVPRKVDVTDTEAAKALLVERLLNLRDHEGTPAYTPDNPPALNVVAGESEEITDPTEETR